MDQSRWQVAFLVHLAQDDNPLLVGQIHAYAVNHHFNHCQIPPQAIVLHDYSNTAGDGMQSGGVPGRRILILIN
jgi:hypothetical protein